MTRCQPTSGWNPSSLHGAGRPKHHNKRCLRIDRKNHELFQKRWKNPKKQLNNWNKSAKSKKREMPILWDLWRIPVVQEVSKGFPFRLVNMPSFPCFAIALARPDDTIRNCLLPILPADQVIRLDFIINLVRNGCLEILRRRAFFNHRSIKIYQNDILCDGMLVLVFFFNVAFLFPQSQGYFLFVRYRFQAAGLFFWKPMSCRHLLWPGQNSAAWR